MLLAGEVGAEKVALPLAVAHGGVKHAEVQTDGTLLPGSVVSRSETGGTLDASIQTQLDRLIEEILPGASDEPSP